MKLQEQSGYEVLYHLVGGEPPPKAPVLMLSSLGSNALKRGAQMLPASGYLEKRKTDAAVLDRAIRQAIGCVEAGTRGQ
jgi:DNA-binding NarL/FixJ family response regulator